MATSIETCHSKKPIPAQIYGVEATKIASDFEVNSARCSGFGKETTTVDIYVYMQGQRRGPYDKAQLEAMWKRGQIPADTLYWHDGMSKWAVISDLLAADKTIPPSLPEDALNAGTTTFPASL
jgi:hypothetical protein